MSVTLLTEWCNIFGGENPGGGVLLGGLSSSAPSRQWYCPTRAIGRYRMECAHGHRGQKMPLCGKHAREFRSGKVQFCPRCNTDPDKGHRCRLSLVEIS